MPSFAGSAYVSSKVSWALQSRAGNQYDLRSRLIIEKDESQESFSQVRQKLHQKNCLKRWLRNRRWRFNVKIAT